MEVTDGYGYGSGYGDGSGSGSGSGSGYGYGDGDGPGPGSGYGYGYSYGYGYGDDYGDDSGYLEALLSKHKTNQCMVVFWRSKYDGTPANGGTGSKAFVGKTEQVEGPLKICTSKALHGTNDPKKWKGERWWIVALHEPAQQQEGKFASLQRTILEDLGKCPF